MKNKKKTSINNQSINTIWYDITIKIFRTGKIKIRQYALPIFKNIAGNSHGKRTCSAERGDKSISERSASRTRKNLIDTVENNTDKFITFITLTFAENETNIDRAYKELRRFLRRLKDQQNKEGKELYYVAVPELQKRGAIHFHIICNVEVGSVSIPLREKKKVKSEGKYRIIEYYDLPFWYARKDGKKESLGFSTAFPLTKEFNSFSIALYMAKYLTKDLNAYFFGRQKVLKSQNLAIPQTYKTQSDNRELINEIKKQIKEYYSGSYVSTHNNDLFSLDFKEYEFENCNNLEEIERLLINKHFSTEKNS